MKGLKIASRYAQSLVELSEERQVTDAVLNDMKWLLTTTNENRDFHLLLNNPLVKVDKKTDIFDKLFGDFQELSTKFIHLLTKNKREMFLPIIAEEYITKVNKIRGIMPIAISSATKIDGKVRDVILAKLNSHIGGSVELTETIDESLIGGFVVGMGDMRIDASISHQLNEMKKRLVR